MSEVSLHASDVQKWTMTIEIRHDIYLQKVKNTMSIAVRSSFALVLVCSSITVKDALAQRKTVSSEEQVIVTGTRSSNQKARNSLSPISIINARQLEETGQSDLRDAIAQLSPSVSLPPFGWGGTGSILSISMRGLSSNHVLVLVNGKRRHQTAWINTTAAGGRGPDPVDLDLIPMSAVDHIEILQDGAAAQYGSDAIAGVVNIILKKTPNKLSLQALNGGYYLGDGFTTSESANFGGTIGKRGFYNVSLEFKHNDRTARAGEDNRAGVPPEMQNDIRQEMGIQPVTRELASINAGYDINDNVSVYAFGTYGHVNSQQAYNYRLPAYYAPNGFIPYVTTTQNDYSFTAGFKGKIFSKWDWDIGTTYGGNINDMGGYNMFNTALLAATGSNPSHFFLGSQSDTQWTTNADIRRAFDTGIFAAPLNLAFGAEYRYETYELGAGDAAARYQAGLSGGAAIQTTDASNHGRDVTAGYIDVGTTLLPKWKIDLAGRFEHYTDAGDTETGKVATRYDLNKFISFRGTVSNGFRAPTLQEEYFQAQSSSPTGNSGQVSVNSAAARFLGARALTPERSTNFSAGFQLNPIPRLHIDIDAYQITLRNRIVSGGTYSGAEAIEALELNGWSPGAAITPNAVHTTFFTNGANTRTRGLDATARYDINLRQNGDLKIDVGLNLNKTVILSEKNDLHGNPLLNAQQRAFLTSYTPKSKLIFGGRWTVGNFDLSVHEIRYGQTTSQLTYYSGPNAYSTSVFQKFTQTPRWQTDIELGYKVNNQLHVALGANNLFNSYLKKLPVANRYIGSNRYDANVAQMSWSGGFYYLRLNYTL